MNVVFGGPSICGLSEIVESTLAHSRTNIQFLPPAKAGDITQAVKSEASRIVLLDGVFYLQRPPWHREILRAINCGIDVIGCASLGAIRAAELFHYGMAHSGEIAKRYVAGAMALPNLSTLGSRERHDVWLESVVEKKVFCDDEDVALTHAGLELGYRPYSLPMVNFVLSFESMKLDKTVKVNCLRALKQIYFRERTWSRVRKTLSTQVLPAGYEKPGVHRVMNEISSAYRDYKSMDAVQLLEQLGTGLDLGTKITTQRTWEETPRMYDENLTPST